MYYFNIWVHLLCFQIYNAVPVYYYYCCCYYILYLAVAAAVVVVSTVALILLLSTKIHEYIGEAWLRSPVHSWRSLCVRVCVRVRRCEGMVDKRQLRGPQSSLDVDWTKSHAPNVVLTLGRRRAERALHHALYAALQGSWLPLAWCHLYGPTHFHLWDELNCSRLHQLSCCSGRVVISDGL